MSKKPRFRTPFDSQHVKGSQALVKSAWRNFYQISSSLWAKLTWKMSLLVICKILGHFVNTMTADTKYSLPNSENLLESIPIQLSKKRIILFFLIFFFYSWYLYQFLNILKKKILPIVYVFPKMQAARDVVKQMSKKHRFRTLFDSRHVKVFQRLVKSAWKLLSDFFITMSKTDLRKFSVLICDFLRHLLINWLAVTSILFALVRTCCNQFKRNYLENKKLFLNFFLHSSNLYEFFSIFKKIG